MIGQYTLMMLCEKYKINSDKLVNKNNNESLVIDGKLNAIFGKQPGLLKKKYNIDIKALMLMYPFENEEKKETKLI